VKVFRATYAAHGDLDRAAADFDRALALDPADIAALRGRGNLHFNMKDYDRLSSTTTRPMPTSRRSFEYRGRAYAARHDYVHAIADFTLVISQEPGNINAYSGRGGAYAALRDLDHVIADFTQVIERDPKNRNAFYNLAIVHQSKQDYEGAIANYTAAIDLDPDAAAFAARSNSYLAKRDYDRAIADYGEATRLDPVDRRSFYNRGIAYQAGQDNDSAIAVSIRTPPRSRRAATRIS
jgi:tetratricopeptide (TPR) repeat protein